MEFFFCALGWILLISFVGSVVGIIIAFYVLSKEENVKIDLCKVAEDILKKK